MSGVIFFNNLCFNKKNQERMLDRLLLRYKNKIFDWDNIRTLFSDDYIKLKGATSFGINRFDRLKCNREDAFNRLLSYKSQNYDKWEPPSKSFFLGLIILFSQYFYLKPLNAIVVFLFLYLSRVYLGNVSIFDFPNGSDSMDINFFNYNKKNIKFLQNKNGFLSKIKGNFLFDAILREVDAIPVCFSSSKVENNAKFLKDQIKTGKDLGYIYADFYLTKILKFHLKKDDYILLRSVEKHSKNIDFIISDLKKYFSDTLFKTLSQGLFSAYVLNKYSYYDFFNKFNSNISRDMLKVLTNYYSEHKFSVLHLIGEKTTMYDGKVAHLISQYAGFSMDPYNYQKFKSVRNINYNDDSFVLRYPDKLCEVLSLFCASGVAGEREFELNLIVYNSLFKHKFIQYNVWNCVLYDNCTLKEFVQEHGTRRMIDIMNHSYKSIEGLESNNESYDIISIFLDFVPEARIENINENINESITESTVYL